MLDLPTTPTSPEVFPSGWGSDLTILGSETNKGLHVSSHHLGLSQVISSLREMNPLQGWWNAVPFLPLPHTKALISASSSFSELVEKQLLGSRIPLKFPRTFHLYLAHASHWDFTAHHFTDSLQKWTWFIFSVEHICPNPYPEWKSHLFSLSLHRFFPRTAVLH